MTRWRITSRVVHLPDTTVDEITTSWSRDLRDRLRVQHVVDETPSIVHDDSLTRDASGRITQRATVDHLGNDRVHDYTYDAAGRLTDHDVDLNGSTERQDDFTLDDLTRRTQDDANGAVAGYTYPAGPPQANMPTTVAPPGTSPRPVQTTAANADGEMSTRSLATFLPAVGSDEVYHYGYAHRVLRMDVTWDGMPGVTCQINPTEVPATFADEWQWQYNYSPTGERETKRLMRSPRHDSSNCGAVLPRVHYLLDAADRQMVVYHGRQTANLTYCNPTQTVRRVFLYPMEYRMYGPDGVAVVWERDQNAQLVPRAVSTDAQGSERYVHGTGMALSRDYRAFGVELGLMQPQRRTGWIGKERDHETSPLFPAHKLMDLSARRYDPMTALFTSVDELWAAFPQQHGYHYAYHDPVNFRDPSGMNPGKSSSTPQPGTGTGQTQGERSLRRNSYDVIRAELWRLYMNDWSAEAGATVDAVYTPSSVISDDDLARAVQIANHRANAMREFLTKSMDISRRYAEAGEAREAGGTIMQLPNGTLTAAHESVSSNGGTVPIRVTVDGTFDTDVDPRFVGTFHSHLAIVNGQTVLNMGPSVPDLLATGRLQENRQRPMPQQWTALIQEANTQWAIVVTDPIEAMRIALTLERHTANILGFDIADVDMSETVERSEYLQALSDLFQALNSLHVGIYVLQSTGDGRGFR